MKFNPFLNELHELLPGHFEAKLYFLFQLWKLSFFWGRKKKPEKNEKRPSMAFDHILRSSSVGAVCSGVAMAQFAISLLLSHIAFALSCLREEDVVTPLKASEWTLSKEFVFEV